MSDHFVMLFQPALEEFGDLTKAAVFGLIWRRAQNGAGICEASHQHLADTLTISKRTVERATVALVKDGYVEDHRLEGRQRRTIPKYSITPKGLALIPEKSSDKMSSNNEASELNPEENKRQNVANGAEISDKMSLTERQNVANGSDKRQNDATKRQNVEQRYNSESTTTTTTPPPDENQPAGLNDDTQIKAALQQVGELYETYFGSLDDPLRREDFIQTLQIYGPGVVESAVRVAIIERANGQARTWGYVKSILEGEHNGQRRTNPEKPGSPGATPGDGYQNGRGPGPHRKTRRRRGRKGRDDSDGLLGDAGVGAAGGYDWVFDILGEHEQSSSLGEL